MRGRYSKNLKSWNIMRVLTVLVELMDISYNLSEHVDNCV